MCRINKQTEAILHVRIIHSFDYVIISYKVSLCQASKEKQQQKKRNMSEPTVHEK